MSTERPVSFTHVSPGTPAIVWQRHPEWGTAEPIRLDGVSRLVVLAAHPDDESLGAGGLVASAVKQGIAVEIVSATDGEGSHPDSPTLTQEGLGAVRAEEARAAAGILGATAEQVHQLGLPDGGLADHLEGLTDRLAAIVGDGRMTVVVAPWRQDGHPDHEAAGRAAAAVARRTGADLWEYPVWFWHWGRPEEAPFGLLRPFALDEPALQAKRDAIHAHASQVAPLSALQGDEALLPPEFLAHFAEGPEHYLRTPSADCPDPRR